MSNAARVEEALNDSVYPTKGITIALMGATGTGKSTFVNLVSGSNFKVGEGLRSCTSNVNASQAFLLQGVPVTLIDTPGFDDTTFSDTDILKLIASYFSQSYENGRKLNGVIYMHRITDLRMSGTSRKNFNMFRKLCGDAFLDHVAIATNMWNQIAAEVGQAREDELRTDELMFKPVLDLGATLLRHDNSLKSAENILLHLINKPPSALRIQEELVDEGKDITQTDACQELDRELAEARKRNEQELAELTQQMKEALAAKDQEALEELERAREEARVRIGDVVKKRETLSQDFAQERKEEENWRIGTKQRSDSFNTGDFSSRSWDTVELDPCQGIEHQGLDSRSHPEKLRLTLEDLEMKITCLADETRLLREEMIEVLARLVHIQENLNACRSGDRSSKQATTTYEKMGTLWAVMISHLNLDFFARPPAIFCCYFFVLWSALITLLFNDHNTGTVTIVQLTSPQNISLGI